MRTTLSLSLAFVFALFATTAESTAQVTTVPNSGCTGATAPTTTGQPNVNQPFGIVCNGCNPSNIARVLLGTPLQQPITLDPSIGCSAGCTLVTDPIAIEAGSQWMVQIPNDPTFVNFCFRVQCACIDTSGSSPCVTLGTAVDVCIQP